jgi:peptidoglycan/LPS O-acetylase OafA/YrhL
VPEPVPAPDRRPDPPLGRRIRYLPGLDGLRAVAVLAVVGYHADLVAGATELVRGGFLGVEVFFVISGYLITSILLNQWRADGRIDLRAFYANRARRLLPALAATMGAVVVLSVLLLPDEVASLRGDVAASLVYATNWFFIVTNSSYFESVGRPSLLQHLWSLAVEEQFYLAWPLLFAAGMRWLGRRRLAVAAAVAAAGSAALMAVLHARGADLTRLYEGTDTRAAGLLVGVVLAFAWSPTRLRAQVGEHAPLVLDGIGAAAAVALAWLLLTTDEYAESLYRFGFLRIAVLTAVVMAVAVHPAARLGRALGCRPLAWIGRRSYGIYLYHWPVFQLTRPGLDVPLGGWPLLVLRLAITLGLAELSFRYLETPVRQGALGRWRATVLDAMARDPDGAGRTWTFLTGTFVVLAVAVGVAVVQAQSPPAPGYLAAGSVGGGLPPAEAAVTTTAPVPPAPPSTVAVPVTVAGPVPDPSGSVPVPVPMPGPEPVPVPAPVVRRITALGDSVMLGAAPQLHDRLAGDVFVDAAVSRQVADGLGVLRSWRDSGRLGDVVVVQLGDNGTLRPAQLDELRDLLAGVPRVVIVNVRVPRPWEGHNNELIAQGVATMPNAVLVDWHGASEGRPELFQDDGLHLRPDGAALYAGLVAEAL